MMICSLVLHTVVAPNFSQTSTFLIWVSIRKREQTTGKEKKKGPLNSPALPSSQPSHLICYLSFYIYSLPTKSLPLLYYCIALHGTPAISNMFLFSNVNSLLPFPFLASCFLLSLTHFAFLLVRNNLRAWWRRLP